MMKYNIKIVGKGKQLAAKKVLSTELEKRLNLESGFIEDKIGVKQRYWIEKGETNATLGAKALQKALVNANIDFEDLDLLLNASATFDYPLPSTATFIQKELKKTESGIPAYDINSSCISFLNGLEIVASFLQTGAYKRIGIVSSEISSKGLNINNIETYSLFGDGAVAFILEKSEGESYCKNFKFNTYSKGAFYTAIKGGGNALHYHDEEAKKRPDDFYFQMQGSKVLRYTIKLMKQFLSEYIPIEGKQIHNFKHIIPHQASKLGLLFFKKNYSLSSEQLHLSLSKYGNTIAASIPMTLYDAIEEGKIKRGDEILFLGTAAGITLGAAIMKY